MRSKFQVGSQVFLNGRTPQGILDPRHRARTVVAVRYSPQAQACFYELGDNHISKELGLEKFYAFGSYPYRSYMLHPISEMPGVGHPRVKRQYHYHRHYTQSKSNTISLDNSVVATVLQDRKVAIKQGCEVLYTLVEKNGVFKRQAIK